MKCTLCGHEFDEASAAKACANCPLAKGCDLVRCPNCGFELPVEPRWLKTLKAKWNRRKRHDVERSG